MGLILEIRPGPLLMPTKSNLVPACEFCGEKPSIGYYTDRVYSSDNWVSNWTPIKTYICNNCFAEKGGTIVSSFTDQEKKEEQENETD